jgi:hypothetical protein
VVLVGDVRWALPFELLDLAAELSDPLFPGAHGDRLNAGVFAGCVGVGDPLLVLWVRSQVALFVRERACSSGVCRGRACKHVPCWRVTGFLEKISNPSYTARALGAFLGQC